MHEDRSALSIQAAILLGAVIIAGSILWSGGVFDNLRKFSSPSAAKPATSSAPAVAGAPTGQPVNVSVGNLPVKGDNNAPVTVIEFADFQCPFCGAVSGFQANGPVASQILAQDKTWQPYEPGIMNDYVKTGKVKFAYRDFAFLGQESNDAANAARCANDQGKFWEYHDKLFSSQNGENKGAFSKDNLKKFASDLGLNTAQFNDCVDQNKYAQAVQDDTAAGRTAGVTGTPALFVSGKLISGAVGYNEVKAAIDAALGSKK